jgi:cell division septation protein DedD
VQSIRRAIVVVLLATTASCGGGSGGSSGGGYCETVTDLQSDLSDLGDLDLSNAAEATEFAQGWADAMSKLGRNAPTDLEDAFAEANDPLDSLDDALRDDDLGVVAASSEGADLIDALDKRGVTGALSEIDDYTDKECDDRIKAERSIGNLVEAAPSLAGGGTEPPVDTTPVESTPVDTVPVNSTPPPVSPSTTRPPLVLPTNPTGTIAPGPEVTSPPVGPDETLVREPTQEEAQALSTAIKDTWPELTAEQATCVGTEMLRLFLFDDILTMLEDGDTAIDGALFIGATLCDVDPDIFFS